MPTTKYKIPRTNLELSREEISAVIDYVYEQNIRSNKDTDETRREEMLKKYKINTKRTFDNKGRPPLPNSNSIFVKY